MEGTDHLSDRELYSHLWHQSLRDDIPEPSEDDGARGTLMCAALAATRTLARISRFMHDAAREDWLKEFPDYVMPPKQDPPYDRDRHLPRPDWRGCAM